MPRSRNGPWRERRWPWSVTGYAVLFTVVAAVTAFVYDSAAPANRAWVIRLAVAFVAGVLLIRIGRYFRGDPRWSSPGHPPSAFADALIRQPVAPRLDPGFVKLREDVANGSASRAFFDKILWPRLAALARAQGADSDLKPPAPRVWRTCGPSRRTIAALLDRIESHRG
jgi:hypothetical protein